MLQRPKKKPDFRSLEGNFSAVFTINDIPLIIAPLGLLVARGLRSRGRVVTLSFVLSFALFMIVLEKGLMHLMGASGGVYTLVGVRFTVWLIPVILSAVCWLLTIRNQRIAWLSTIGAYVICVLFAMVRQPGAAVDLVNHTRSLFERFLEQTLLTVSLIASVLIPLNCPSLNGTQPQSAALNHNASSPDYKVVLKGGLVYVLIFVLGSVILQGTLLNYYLIVPFFALLKAAFLRGVYYHLIDQYLAFRLTETVLQRLGYNKTERILEVVLSAGLYVMLQYYLFPAYLIWTFLLGLPLAYIYRATGKLRYGVILALLFDIFTH